MRPGFFETMKTSKSNSLCRDSSFLSRVTEQEFAVLLPPILKGTHKLWIEVDAIIRLQIFFNCTSFCLAPFPPFLFLRKSDSGFAPKNLFFSKWMTYPCCHNCIVVILTANLHHDPRVMLQFSPRFKWSLAFWREKQNRYPLFSLILLRVLWLDLGFERLRRSPLYSDDSCEDSLTLCNGAQETKRLAFSHNHFFRIDAKDLLHYCSSACKSTRTMRKRHNHTVGRCHL